MCHYLSVSALWERSERETEVRLLELLFGHGILYEQLEDSSFMRRVRDVNDNLSVLERAADIH